MASNPSNFDAEIKKGMQLKGAKSSTNASPAPTPAKNVGTFNAKPKASAPQPNDTSGDTHSAMVAAGQAHMDAIHAHINAMNGGE